jgi:uncharacterized UPF0146 family protein
MSADDSEAPDCGCKVGTVATQYGLDGIHRRLARLWASEEDHHSLRDLEELFNVDVLAAALERAGASPVEGEVENFYRILRDDDVSEGSRIEVRNRLQREGVDVAAVTDDFVSHQTIHGHLRDCLDASYDPETDPETRLRNGRDAVFGLRNRTRSVTRNTLDRLDDADAIDLGDADVFVDITVSCEDCGTIASVDEILDDGGCDCRPAE